MDIPEAKSLRWLANMFPLQIPVKDADDKMCNAIHLYCTAGADKIEALELSIQEMDVKLQEAQETIDNLRDEIRDISNRRYHLAEIIKDDEIRDISNRRYHLAEIIKDAVDRIFDGEFEEE